MWARQVWLVEEMKKHIPREVFEGIWVESEVNQMDPDFNFYEAVFGEPPTPIPPLDL
jgi:hypothetical protein